MKTIGNKINLLFIGSEAHWNILKSNVNSDDYQISFSNEFNSEMLTNSDVGIVIIDEHVPFDSFLGFLNNLFMDSQGIERSNIANMSFFILRQPEEPELEVSALRNIYYDNVCEFDNIVSLESKIRLFSKIHSLNMDFIKNKQDLVNVINEKNEFLGIAAHDLKNPIYSISMLAKVIKNESDLTRTEINEFSQDIITTSQRMIDLITNLLDLNKIEQGQIRLRPEKLDLNEIIKSIIEIYKERADSKSINLRFKSNVESARAELDRHAIFQIMDNLISNAVKYSPYGKTISTKLHMNKSHFEIEVEDEGPGIRDEEMNLLFEKFAKLSSKPTSDEDSTGLGLSIVKKYVEIMGGEVYCKSIFGIGSRFVVILPINAK